MDLSDESVLDESVALAENIPSAMQFIPKPDDEHVIVEYEGEQCPGQVKTVDDDGAFVSCMTRCGLSWKWPEKPDCIFYPMDKIISPIKPPSKLGTKRALFRVPELEYKWGQPKK